VALLPAALIGLPRNVLLAGVVGALLAWLPVVVQNQYFLYHATALPVLGAVCLYGALRRAGPLFVLPVLAASGGTYYVLTRSAGWRMVHQTELFTVAALTAGGMVVLSIGWHIGRWFLAKTTGPRPVVALLAVLLGVATWVPASAPNAAESVTLSTRDNTPRLVSAASTGQQAWAEAMRQRIGPDTRVTYLTFGTTNYMLRNPSTCEFPTGVILQRSRTIRRQEGTPTWRANLRCLTDKPGQLLVWDPQWFLLRRQPPEVKAALAAAFDCEQGFTVDRIQVCPRRV
jgi:hypothetical protein